MTASARPAAARRGSAPRRGVAPRTPADTVNAAVLLSAAANVVMQLALPPVGHGVAESVVDEGNLLLHPARRFRTTNAYLGVALLGTDDERRTYRRAVGRSHSRVHSGPDSPVRYDAFDRDAQLWVAACLVRAFEDTWALLAGEPGRRLPDDVYRRCAVLGTTLQVRPEQWPADRDAFEEYWSRMLEHVHLDDVVRAHLWRVVRHDFLPTPLARATVGLSEFVTAGYLHEPFRTMMGISWSADDQRRFEAGMARLGSVLRALPPSVRGLPYTACLADLRRRRRRGLPLL